MNILNLTPTQTAAITVIATAVLGVITALLTRPVPVATITAAFATALGAAAAFGLHLSADQIGTAVTGLSVVLGLLLRGHVSPKAAP